MRITFLLIFLLLSCKCLIAQQKIIKQFPIVTAGSALGNGNPYNLNPNDTVIFKGVTEIELGPDLSIGSDNEFSAENYNISTLGYFHAYLIPPLSFAELKMELDGNYFPTIENVLRFKYDEKYLDGGNLNFQVFDYQRNPMITSQILPVQNIGASFFELDVSAILAIRQKDLSLEENKYYILEVKNGKGDLYKLRFKYIPVQ